MKKGKYPYYGIRVNDIHRGPIFYQQHIYENIFNELQYWLILDNFYNATVNLQYRLYIGNIINEHTVLLKYYRYLKNICKYYRAI